MTNKRSLGLDVFRGLTVALMILVNNPGSWGHVYAPFLHAQWHGLTPTDLVFPFFLFAVGNAQALVLPKMWTLHSKEYFFKKVWKRTLFIFLIGLFLNWFPFFAWSGDDLIVKDLRIMGVLQRIALSYGFSALLVYYFPKKVLTLSLVLLLLYWGLCVAFGTGDVYSLEGWFGTAIDRSFLGSAHLYHGEGVPFDPEGLMSTIPAIAQVMLGYWAGRILAAYMQRKSLRSLLKRGLILLALGCLWHFAHPINKKIWTGSYVLVTTGLAMVSLTLLAWWLDHRGNKGKAWYVFEAFGKNPLFIYVLSGLLPKAQALVRIPQGDSYLTPLKWFYENVCTRIPGPPENASLFYAIVFVGFFALIAVFLDRKKIYIRV